MSMQLVNAAWEISCFVKLFPKIGRVRVLKLCIYIDEDIVNMNMGENNKKIPQMLLILSVAYLIRVRKQGGR